MNHLKPLVMFMFYVVFNSKPSSSNKIKEDNNKHNSLHSRSSWSCWQLGHVSFEVEVSHEFVILILYNTYIYIYITQHIYICTNVFVSLLCIYIYIYLCIY